MLISQIRFPFKDVSFLQMPRRLAARYALFAYLGISIFGWLGVMAFFTAQGPPQMSLYQWIAIVVIGGLIGFFLQYLSVMSVINARMIRNRIVSTSGKFLFRGVVILAGIVAFVLTLYATVVGSFLAILIVT